MQAIAEQLIVGGFEIVEQQGFQAVFGVVSVFATYQTVDILCIRLDEFLEDVDAEITRGTREQDISQ